MEPRYIITPCCNYKQSTKVDFGQVVRCTVCKKAFTENKK